MAGEDRYLGSLMNVDWERTFEQWKRAIETPITGIAPEQITMTAPHLLGRTTAGTGGAEEITVSSPLTLAALTLGIAGSALTRVNDTNVTLTLGGSPATALLAAASLTLGWTGTLGLARGGTAADLSATGGASQVLKQSSVGAAVTVGVLAGSDITGAALTKTDDTNVTLTLGGTPTTALLRAASLTLGWTGTLGVTRGGTGTGTAFTLGSVVFAGASGVYTQDNANFFWDDTNNRLGIGGAPTYHLDVQGTSNTIGIRVSSSTAGDVLYYGTGTVTGNIAFLQSAISATGIVQSKFANANNANSGADASLEAQVGGASAGDPYILMTVLGVQNWVLGIDNSDSDKLKIGPVGVPGSAGNATFVMDTSSHLGLGTASPTATLHLKAGTTVASSAPLKFNSGSLMTTAEAGAVEFLTDNWNGTITTGAARKGFVLDDGARLTSGLVPVATTNGRLIDGPALTAVVIVRDAGRSIAQVAAVASVATYTLTAADASFMVDACVTVTTSTTHNFTVAVDYTDETNTANTQTLTFSQLTGVFLTAITNVTGAGVYNGAPLHIRCKASTAITIKTVGVFTAVVYNVEGNIRQVAA